MTTKILNTSTINITLLLLLVGVAFPSCNRTSPRKYVAVTVLNTNLVTGRYRPAFFNELRELKKQNRIPDLENGQQENGTAVDYVRQMVIAPVDESIEKVQELKATDDTRDLIVASLDVFQYGRAIFENEYITIAEMLDGNKPQEEIDSAIQKMFEARDPEMEKKFKRLDELAIPYAKKHDVPLQ